MRRPGGETLPLVEAIEAIRAHCLQQDPALEERLNPPLPWRDLPAGERRTLLFATMEDLPLDTAAERRQARQAAQDLSTMNDREEKDPLLSALDWVASEAFTRDLAGAAGPVSAMNLVRRSVPKMTAPRAARFLLLLGYDTGIPTLPIQRFFQRVGLLTDAGNGVKGQERTTQALGDLAAQSGLTVRNLYHILDSFTAKGSTAALCGREPKCSRCPAQDHCPTGRAYGELGVREDSEKPTKLTDVYAPGELPREKLLNLGAERLSNAELLAILLRKGNGKIHALALANSLLRDEVSGGIDKLATMTVHEMMNKGGLGQVQAITLKASMELSRRLASPGTNQEERITSSRQIFNRFRNHFLHQKQEIFLQVLLSTKNEIFHQVEISRGTLNQSLVHPRDAFQLAVRNSASAVIFIHNHPSGDPTPSRDDLVITKRLYNAGDLLGIRVLDHVIIGRDTYYSFRDEGTLTGEG